MKFGFIARHRGIWPVAWLCEALDVSRSGFHAWLRRGLSARAQADEELTTKVRASFVGSARTYGARRVWRDLLADGVSCGLHKIERLMRANALRARPRRRGLPKDSGQASTTPAANVSTGNSRPSVPTRNGLPTLPTFGPPRAGSTSPPSSICFRAAWSAGR